MKILMLTPYLPYPLVSGGQIRTYNLLKNLAKKHDITLFSLIKEERERQYIKNLEPYCKKIQVFKRSAKPFTLRNIFKAGFSLYPFVVTRNLVPETIEAVKKELEVENYDLIHAETFYMMPNIPKTNIPIILVEQTIEYLGYQSYAQSSKQWFLKPLLYVDIAKIKYWENYYWRYCDRLITMSPNDKEYILEENPNIKQIDVVANGVDIEYFNAVPKKLPTKPTILFVGTFYWLPNVQAVNYLIKEIWPIIRAKLPQAHLHIVGFRPTAEIQSYNRLPHVKVSGSIKDIRQAYRGAHVLLAPVMWGKGTRYKILEAMATKTPIVATPLAVEGIEDLVLEEHVRVGITAEDLAAEAIKVLTDTKLQKKLSSKSYELVNHHYNWQAISKDLDRVYRELGSKS
jgi:glycosyltransferase involved in cell wall biosynthesis